MEKSPDAFRTISEVAELLETPPHVLRFWESRFPQIRPVKRAGGRRYYRPVDVALLIGIRHLLHDEGMTIRGVQKILREHGVRHVSGVADDAGDQAEAASVKPGTDPADRPGAASPAAPGTAKIITLETAMRKPGRPDQKRPVHEISAQSVETTDAGAVSGPDTGPDTVAVPAADSHADLLDRLNQMTATPDDAVPDDAVPDDAVPARPVVDTPPDPAGTGTDRPDGAAQAPAADEAPMQVWAEAITEDTAPLPMPPNRPRRDPHHAETAPAPIAPRLRATLAADLSPSVRASLRVLRARARSLRDRLDSQPRTTR